MEVLEAIKTRRSIRKYKSTPVDEQTLELILDAARWAPSWANTQCWRFIVVQNSRIKNSVADTQGLSKDGSPNPAFEATKQAPLLIVACAELGKSGFRKGNPSTERGDWFMFDVALAMQNLVLAAHSLGLATVHIGNFDAKKVAKILKIPQGYCAVEMTPLGYPDQQRNPRPRKELSEIVFYNRFGAR